MTPAGLAWRSAAREPARTLLAVAGIAAVGALLFDMLLLSRGLLVSFRDLLDSVEFDVRATATTAYPTQGPPIAHAAALVDNLRRLPEVAVCIPFRFARASVVMPSGGPSPTLSLIGAPPLAQGRGAWTLLRGEGLAEQETAAEPGILINETLARALRLEPGATVRIAPETSGEMSVLPPVRFRVRGVASFAFEGAGDQTAATTLSALARVEGGVHDGDAADLLLIASARDATPDTVVAAVRRLRPDLHVFTNEEFLSNFSRTDFSYFRQISFVLSTITLFFAFLLVATLLTVAVNQRFGEVAALRAIGFSRRRVAEDLLAESALLVLTGALLSIPLGLVLSRGLDSILRTMPGFPTRLHFFVFEPRAVLLQIALLAGVGVLATLYPILLAVRLPIAATLRREIVT